MEGLPVLTFDGGVGYDYHGASVAYSVSGVGGGVRCDCEQAEVLRRFLDPRLLRLRKAVVLYENRRDWGAGIFVADAAEVSVKFTLS